jgi:hypothetical protein
MSRLTRKRLNKEEQSAVVDLYSKTNLSCTKIGEIYNVGYNAIVKILKKNQICIEIGRGSRKYSCNSHYFDVIDTEEKAYFLGLLYADGCNEENINRVRLSLQKSDAYMIEKFKIAINSDSPISITERTKLNSNYSDIYHINIHDRYFSQHLKVLGLVPNKSKILKFPENGIIFENMIKHFIRGFYDGNGSCTVRTRKYGREGCIGLTSASDFINEVSNILTKNIGITPHIELVNTKNDNNVRKMSFAGTKKAFMFLNWLYTDATIYFERKYNKFLELESVMIEKGWINDNNRQRTNQ